MSAVVEPAYVLTILFYIFHEMFYHESVLCMLSVTQTCSFMLCVGNA